MTKVFPERATNRAFRYELIPVVIAILGVIASYIGSVNGAVAKWTSSSPPGYYGLLTDALLSGQLDLKVRPDPRLAQLENPYAGAQGVPRIHDATYFNGRYYLYFGVTPVIVLFAPWKLLTGVFLTEAGGSAIFAAIGFLLSVRLWLRLKRDLLPELGAFWAMFGVVVLGWGNYAFFLLQNSEVYNVPILAAFACVMAAFNFIERAFNSPKPVHRAIFLGLASLAWGLAVGSRPNYVLGIPILGALGLVLWRSTGKSEGYKIWSTWRILFWTIVPAAAVGFGLAWYNYMRFGDVTEFGVKYQFAASDQRFTSLSDFVNFPVNLSKYLWLGYYYSPYFPFVWPRGDVQGLFIWAPFAMVGALFPFARKVRLSGHNAAWPILAVVFIALILLHFTSLCLLPFANGRYLLDFLPTLLLLALVTAGIFIVKSHRLHTVVGYSVSCCIICLAAATVLPSLLLGVQRQPNKSAQDFLAYCADYPARWWESWFGVRHGAVELQIIFPELVPDQSEPLVVTGFGRDIIYLKAEDATHARFGFFHQGAGGPLSEPIEIEPGRKYSLAIDIGGLYPPPEHPVFRGWDVSVIDAVRRRVYVRLDGKLVLHWNSNFYPSQPFEVSIGKNPGPDVTVPVLHAQILNLSRAGMPSPNQVADLPGDGPVRLTVKFPAFSSFATEPLISTGRPGKGDLFYVTYIDAGHIRFGHDSWQFSNVETMDVAYDPNREHTIDVDMGSLHATATGLAEARNPLQVRFDGKLLISKSRSFHPTSPADISIGFNTTGSSVSAPGFTGPLLRAERLPAFSTDITP